MTNPLIKDWVKIGFTNRKTRQRLKEYQTYAPDDFEIYYEIEVEDAIKVEKEVHKRLKAICEKKKEWFKVSARFAQNIVEGVIEELDTYGKFDS